MLPDRLQVRDALLAELDVDAEAALQPLDGDLDVHLAHAGEELLARLLVAAQVQRRILLGEAAEGSRHLLLVALRLRRDREAHHGLGEGDRRQLDLPFRIEEDVAGHRLLQLRDRADVALAERLRLHVLLALEQ